MVRTLLILIVGSALGVLGALAYFELTTSSNSTAANESTGQESSRKPQRRSIMALGTLEPRDGTNELTSPLVGYLIKRVCVREGQAIGPGEVLIELDPAAAETELLMAKAQKAEAAERQQSEIAM